MPARPGKRAIRSNIIMLTADAFGVMPPIARLTPAQAMYHFLSGYTAKVAGTERGVTEPEATFSTCFGAPFMPRHPSEYGDLLRRLIAAHGVDCWLVNTGWTGGAYGTGRRMPIRATRALLAAALDGSLGRAGFRTDPNFGFAVPVSAPGIGADVVDPKILDPRETWADKAAYDRQAKRLVGMFTANFAPLRSACRRGGDGRRARNSARRRIAAHASRRPGGFSFAARRVICCRMGADDIIITDEAVIRMPTISSRRSSVRRGRAARTSTRSRPPCNCVSMPPMRRGLSDRVRERVIALAGQKATKDGVIIFEAGRFRTQEQNRADARARLTALVAKAAEPPPKPRRKTRPSKGAVERRLKAKAGRSTVKKMRGRIDDD